MPTPLKVVVRVRPVLSSKGEEDQGINQYVQVNATAQQLTTGFGPRAKTSTYTNTLGPKTNQEEFFQKVGVPALDDIWGGKSSTLLAYGPRGSGKRFTTFGTKKEQGLIPRFATQLFERLSAEKNGSYKVEFSFFELYCEECNDLLLPSGRNLPVSYIENVGYHALGLTRCPVMDYNTLDTILEASLTARAVSAVSSNTDTIQAHTFFQLIVTRTSVDKTTMKALETTSTLLIGDLGDAGGGEEERAAISSINASPGDSHGKLVGGGWVEVGGWVGRWSLVYVCLCCPCATHVEQLLLNKIPHFYFISLFSLGVFPPLKSSGVAWGLETFKQP
jgi:hypothetical protein